MSTPSELPYVNCLPCYQDWKHARWAAPLCPTCVAPSDSQVIILADNSATIRNAPGVFAVAVQISGKVSQSQSQAVGGMRLGGGCTWQPGWRAGRLTGLIPSFLFWIVGQPGDNYTVGCVISVGICFWEVLAMEAGESVCPSVCLFLTNATTIGCYHPADIWNTVITLILPVLTVKKKNDKGLYSWQTLC